MTPEGSAASGPAERFEEFLDPVDGTRWSVDVGFLGSGWRCRWGDGCVGILDEPAPELEQGCCSVGAELLDADEARTIAALAATLDPDLFQHGAEADAGGVVVEDRPGPGRWSTRIVDGACIFLNRPGFPGGTGCALHLAAVDEDEDPIDWKPAVCWQLPLKVEEEADGRRRLRRWRRDDWGPDGQTMAWCCTEDSAGNGLPSAYARADAETGAPPRPVAETLAGELRALVGPEVAVAIRARVVS